MTNKFIWSHEKEETI